MLVDILARATEIVAIKKMKIKMADHPISVHLEAAKRTRQSNGLNMKWHFAQLMNHYPTLNMHIYLLGLSMQGNIQFYACDRWYAKAF